MEFKLSAVLDEQMEPGAQGILDIALGKHDSHELSSAVALLEDFIPPLSGSEIRLQDRRAEPPGSDNYQVALVPLANKTERAPKNSQARIEMKPVFVLPLTWGELVGRVRAGASLSGSSRESSVVRFGDVRVDFSSMEVSRSREPVALTTLEFKLLKFLIQNAGRVISRDEMLNEVWGYDNYPCTRTVDNHILRLRHKLEPDPARPVHFHTVHGAGYKFVLAGSRVVAEHEM